MKKYDFEALRSQIGEDKKSTVDGKLVSVGIDLLEQFMSDFHRIADALELISYVIDRASVDEGGRYIRVRKE